MGKKLLSAETAAPGEWKAWFNLMPGAAKTLHVLGDIDVGNVDDFYTLKFDSEEKSNPPILVLRIEELAEFAPRSQGDTRVQLHFTQAAQPGRYAAVKVLYPDDSELTLDTFGVTF